MTEPDWGNARCGGLHAEGVDFHPEGLSAKDRRAHVAMLAVICEACPIKAACLAYAEENEHCGVWGGKDFGEEPIPQSDVPGVHWKARSGKWVVETDYGGFYRYAGLFDDLLVAEATAIALYAEVDATRKTPARQLVGVGTWA